MSLISTRSSGLGVDPATAAKLTKAAYSVFGIIPKKTIVIGEGMIPYFQKVLEDIRQKQRIDFIEPGIILPNQTGVIPPSQAALVTAAAADLGGATVPLLIAAGVAALVFILKK